MAAIFGARSSVEDASLSPDGTHMAYIQPAQGQGSILYIADLDHPELPPKNILVASGKPERLTGCNWASNSRLLCNVVAITRLDNADISYVSRMVALDSVGGNLKMLSNRRGTGATLGYSLFGGSVIDWAPGEDGHVLMMREYVPEKTTGTRLAQTKDGYGVDDIDTMTLKARPRENPKDNAASYISDGSGIVRIMGLRIKTTDSGYSSGQIRYYYRLAGDRDWKPLSLVDQDGNGFEPVAVDPTLNVAYGLKRVDGRLAAFSVALDGSLKEVMLFSRPDVDVDDFVRIGRKHRVIGVSFVTEKREVAYFDPALQKLAAGLAKAIPALPLIRIINASQDEKRLLLWAGADNDPGRYYMFDRTTRKLGELMLARPFMEKMPLSKVQAVSYAAADGMKVPAYLTLPPSGPAKGLPAIVMPHGGPGARDEWGFDWLSQYFASQGYAVLQPNFRGSTGYGDQWFRKNGFKDWKVAIGDIDDGGRWLLSSGIAAPGKIAIFGWSYGGYAALQSAVTEPGLFKAVVAVAPVTDLDRLKNDRRNWSDFLEVSNFVGTGPHVDAGSPARHASAIKVPVLMFHGTVDRNVDVGHSQLMEGRLKSAGVKSELVIYKDLDHYLDDSQARADMLRKSTGLLHDAIGGGVATNGAATGVQ